MNLLAKGQALLQRLMPLEATPAGALTFRRGTKTADLTGLAWVGRTIFSSNAEGGARIEFGDRDYLIPAVDFVLDGAAITPRIGDRFEEVIDTETLIFEVLTPNTGELAWRYSDSGRQVLRIHTVKVK